MRAWDENLVVLVSEDGEGEKCLTSGTWYLRKLFLLLLQGKSHTGEVGGKSQTKREAGFIKESKAS